MSKQKQATAEESVEIGVPEPEREAAMAVKSPYKAPPAWCPFAMNGAAATFDLETLQGRALLVNCGSPGDIKLKPDEMLHVMVDRLLFFPDTVTGLIDGKPYNVMRTCLITKSGSIYRTTAEHAADWFGRLYKAFGANALADGIAIEITERDSARPGFTYHDFRVRVS